MENNKIGHSGTIEKMEGGILFVKKDTAILPLSPSSTSPTPKPTFDPQPQSSPTLSSISKLVSTGSNIWVNLFIALVLTAGIGYFLVIKQKHEEKPKTEDHENT